MVASPLAGLWMFAPVTIWYAAWWWPTYRLERQMRVELKELLEKGR